MYASEMRRGDVFKFPHNEHAYRFDGGVSCVALNGPRRGETIGISLEQEVYRQELEPGIALHSLQRLADDALQAQNASNLSGVVHAFARATAHLREYHRVIGEPLGSAGVAHHPITVMYVDKLADMSGRGETFSADYEKCQKMANGDLT